MKVGLKNENNLNNEGDLKTADDFKKEDEFQNEDNLILKAVSSPSLQNLGCACLNMT